MIPRDFFLRPHELPAHPGSKPIDLSVPVVNGKEIGDFESKHGIKLPTELKDMYFVQNGGFVRDKYCHGKAFSIESIPSIPCIGLRESPYGFIAPMSSHLEEWMELPSGLPAIYARLIDFYELGSLHLALEYRGSSTMCGIVQVDLDDPGRNPVSVCNSLLDIFNPSR